MTRTNAYGSFMVSGSDIYTIHCTFLSLLVLFLLCFVLFYFTLLHFDALSVLLFVDCRWDDTPPPQPTASGRGLSFSSLVVRFGAGAVAGALAPWTEVNLVKAWPERSAGKRRGRKNESLATSPAARVMISPGASSGKRYAAVF